MGFDNAEEGSAVCSLIPNLKVEVVGTVLHKGLSDRETFAQLDALAASIARAHAADEHVQRD